MRTASLAILLFAAACQRKVEDAAAPSASVSGALIEAAEEAPVSEQAAQNKGSARSAGERVTIAAGTFMAGSTPGDRGRDPTLEANQLQVELGEFSIDRLPYPNDPGAPPATGYSRDRAAEACSQRGGRLCNELEWERACKGPEAQSYSGSTGWDPDCATHPESCASGFGVLAMGGALREWTASDVGVLKGYRSSPAVAVRGAAAQTADVDHRCAHRSAVDASTNALDLSFRCCYGQAPSVTIPSPEWRPTVQKIDFPAERLAALFGSSARLKPLADEIKYFREEAAVTTTIQRGKGCNGGAPPPEAEAMTTAPIVWSPVPGEEILVATGQASKNQSFIVAFHRLAGDRHRVAAAMLMEDEPGPVVLVFNQNVRKKLEWAIGWQCPGESGVISYRDENRVAITQH